MATWYIGYNEPEWDVPPRHQLPYWTSKDDDERLGWDTADAAYEYIYENVEAGDTLNGPADLMNGFAGPGSYIARRYEQQPLQE